MNKLGDVFKNKRFIGLVLLTIIVIVGIVLTVYFVQKSEEIQELHIRQIGEDNKTIVVVNTINVQPVDIDGEKGADVVIFMSIKAKGKIEISKEQFLINNQKPTSIEGMQNSELKKGDSINIVIRYKTTNQELLFLEYRDYKIALGNVIV